MSRSTWLGLATLALAACNGSPTTESTAGGRFLLGDKAARANGWALPGTTGMSSLPVALDDAQASGAVVGPGGRVPLDVPDGALAHLRGGAITLYAIDADVRSDRLQIEAPEATARTLAEALGATIIPLTEGRWELSDDQLLSEIAGLPGDGITEAMPVGMDDEAGVPVEGWKLSSAGGAVAAGGAAPSGPRGRMGPLDQLGPDPMMCPDPIVGLWVAKTYRADQGDWHEHTLHIKRRGEQGLTVSQVTHTWDGDKQGGTPPLCDAGGPSWRVITTHGSATLSGDFLHVWGTKLDSSTHSCGGEPSDYNLDSFTGKVDGNTFDSVNNDGALAVNRPYLFHRVRCD